MSQSGYDVDAVVAGAGVVGLAIARELAVNGLGVLVLDPAGSIGSETSSRNSEVIHAGLYYPTDSLKARFCVAGKEQLYAYCDAAGVPYRRCGKLVVACDDGEMAQLEALLAKGRANGVDDLELIGGNAARALEPELAPSIVGALKSPSTGIIDSHALMLALQGEAESNGAQVVLRTAVAAAQVLPDGFAVSIAGGDEPVRCRILVNAAGLRASVLASRIEGLDAAFVPQTRFAKGNYFTLPQRAPFTHLIYPAPPAHGHGLGVHLTLDLAGQARFGPDVEWVEALDYAVDPARGAGFDAAIRTYWPGLPAAALAPGYSGIRPKIDGENGAAPDFRIDGPERHGVSGLVNLFGIESPGLTSSLAIAGEVGRRVLA